MTKDANSSAPIYYMRDNHTFQPLTGTPEEMVALALVEFDAGDNCGLLCSHRPGFRNVHAHGEQKRLEFEREALESLQEDAEQRCRMTDTPQSSEQAIPEMPELPALPGQVGFSKKTLFTADEMRGYAIQYASALLAEVEGMRTIERRYNVLRAGRHGFEAVRLRPKPGKRWRGWSDEGDILKGSELDAAIDSAASGGNHD